MDLDILAQTLNKIVVKQEKLIDGLNSQIAIQVEQIQALKVFTKLLQDENAVLKTALNNNILVK